MKIAREDGKMQRDGMQELGTLTGRDMLTELTGPIFGFLPAAHRQASSDDQD
jgi:hypothetical protein